MLKALFVLVQIILFFVVFAAFSFLAPFGMHWFVSHPSATQTRYFVADGFLIATGLMVLLLLLELAAKRLRGGLGLTMLGYVIAVAAGFGVKLGFITHDLLG